MRDRFPIFSESITDSGEHAAARRAVALREGRTESDQLEIIGGKPSLLQCRWMTLCSVKHVNRGGLIACLHARVCRSDLPRPIEPPLSAASRVKEFMSGRWGNL